MGNLEEAEKPTFWCVTWVHEYLRALELIYAGVLQQNDRHELCLPENLGMQQFHNYSWRRGANLLGAVCHPNQNVSSKVSDVQLHTVLIKINIYSIKCEKTWLLLFESKLFWCSRKRKQSGAHSWTK